MTYRITWRSNPRIIAGFVLAPALPIIGIVSFLVLPPLAGAIITSVGVYIGYQIAKFLRSSLASTVVTRGDGITIEAAGEVSDYTWSEITYAGIYRETNGKPMLYVYNEPSDRLITVPDEYESFEQMADEIQRGVGESFERLDIASNKTLSDYLRSRVTPLEESSTDQTEGSEE
jgi:hypothetical protein